MSTAQQQGVDARPDPARTSSVALKAFFNIMQRWGVDDEQARVLLGAPSRSQFYRLKSGNVRKISNDMLERISYVMGIHKALRILYSDRSVADGWVKRPNAHPIFGDRSALDFMLGGRVTDLADVRRYLDAWRG